MIKREEFKAKVIGSDPLSDIPGFTIGDIENLFQLNLETLIRQE